LADIEKLLGTKLDKEIVPGYDVDPRIKAEPIQNGRSQRSGRPRNNGAKNRRSGPPKSRSGNRNGPPKRRRKQA